MPAVARIDPKDIFNAEEWARLSARSSWRGLALVAGGWGLIVAAGAMFIVWPYLWTVKANQPQLLQDLQDWFDTEVQLIPGMGCPPKDFRSATLPNKGHGRIEVRTLTTSSQLNDFLGWPFLQQVFKLERKVTFPRTGKTRCEVSYGITSLPAEEASPLQLLLMLKTYWQIENGLHYRRDVTLHEDHTCFKKRSAAHNMAIINNLVLALISKANYRLVPSARRFFAAHPDAAISLLL